MSELRKFEIARLFGERYGYKSYLEICTSSTGGTFAHVDKEQFPRRVRVMYNRPLWFTDGEDITISTESENGDELYEKLIRSGEKFDVVFIDPYHTYSASLRDIVYGIQLVSDGGIILLHDCFPPNKTCTSPTMIPGEWCGLTFAAFLDLVLFTSGINYFTIDSDYGCGVICRNGQFSQFPSAPSIADLNQQWRLLGLNQKYDFFEKHHRELLNLISPEEFQNLLFLEYEKNTPDRQTLPLSEEWFNDLVMSNIILEETILENEKTKSALDAPQTDLLKTTALLEDSRRELAAIHSTFTWRLRNFLLHNRLVRILYQKYILGHKKP